MVVENKPAAAGMIATRDVLSQPRDGYTLLLCTHFESINTAVYKNVQFKLSDLAPISLIAKYYYGLALANAIPANDFEAFVQYAKAHPGEVTYATDRRRVGAGDPGAAAREAHRHHHEPHSVPRRPPGRAGAGGRARALLRLAHAGDRAAIPGKQLKILAVSAPERLKNLSEIPTLTDKGVDFVRFGWLGICAGAGTPQPVIDLLQRHIVAIVDTAEYRAMIEKAGSIPVSSTPDELRQVITQTLDDVASSIREFGLQQEQ